MSDDEDDQCALVVDSGRLHWWIGQAGMDSPDNGLTYTGYSFPAHGDSASMAERLQLNWSLLEQHVAEHRTALDKTALFVCSVCDDVESDHVRNIADTLFAPDSSRPGLRGDLSYLQVVPQELLILYASGHTTGLVINLGFDLTICGVYEGHLLGETVRRVPMVASENVFSADPDAWEERTRLGSLLTSAVEAAPIDTRRDLLRSILIGGGRWGGWRNLQAHLHRQIDGWLATRRQGERSGAVRTPMAIKVIQPPESGASAWMGGSILGSLGNRSYSMISADEWRDRDLALVQRRWRLVEPDRAKESRERRRLALERVQAAESLCAKLPAELQHIIVELVGEALRWPELPPLTASNFLPPAEVVGWEAMLQRRQRAAAAAAREEDDRGSAADAHDAEADAALHERMRPAIEELRARLELRGRR
jgi:hypothetical protein